MGQIYSKIAQISTVLVERISQIQFLIVEECDTVNNEDLMLYLILQGEKKIKSQQFQLALSYLEDARQIADNLDKNQQKTYILSCLIYVYKAIKDTDSLISAMKELRQVYFQQQKIQVNKIISITKQIAQTYSQVNLFELAIEQGQKVINVIDALELRYTEEIAQIYQILARCYYYLRFYRKARDCFKEALRIWKKMRNILPILQSEFSLSKTYFRLRQFEKCFALLHKCFSAGKNLSEFKFYDKRSSVQRYLMLILAQHELNRQVYQSILLFGNAFWSKKELVNISNNLKLISQQLNAQEKFNTI